MDKTSNLSVKFNNAPAESRHYIYGRLSNMHNSANRALNVLYYMHKLGEPDAPTTPPIAVATNPVSSSSTTPDMAVKFNIPSNNEGSRLADSTIEFKDAGEINLNLDDQAEMARNARENIEAIHG